MNVCLYASRLCRFCAFHFCQTGTRILSFSPDLLHHLLYMVFPWPSNRHLAISSMLQYPRFTQAAQTKLPFLKEFKAMTLQHLEMPGDRMQEASSAIWLLKLIQRLEGICVRSQGCHETGPEKKTRKEWTSPKELAQFLHNMQLIGLVDTED